jgi:hypothetical protein
VFRSTQAIKQAATPNSAYPQHQQNSNKVRRAMSRASKQIGTNVTKKLLVEIQALIAFACYDSPAIAKGGESMTEGAQSDLIKEMYFRSGGDPEIISFVDQFIHGLHRFTGLFTL